MNANVKYLKDESGNTISPVTGANSVFDNNVNYYTDKNTLVDFWSINNYSNSHQPNFAGYYNSGSSTTAYNTKLKKSYTSTNISSGVKRLSDFRFVTPILASGLLFNSHNTYYVVPFYESSEVFVRIEFEKSGNYYIPKITCGSSDYSYGLLNLFVLYHEGI